MQVQKDIRFACDDELLDGIPELRGRVAQRQTPAEIQNGDTVDLPVDEYDLDVKELSPVPGQRAAPGAGPKTYQPSRPGSLTGCMDCNTRASAMDGGASYPGGYAMSW